MVEFSEVVCVGEGRSKRTINAGDKMCNENKLTNYRKSNENNNKKIAIASMEC